MKLTDDESRALAFIAGLLLLSAAVRIGAAREPVEIPAGGGLDLAAHIDATRAAVAAVERAARPLAPGERVDPSAADATELDRLPRVGPKLAARIVEDRERNGPFRSPEDLLRVPGVGPRMLEEVRPHLAFAAGAGAGREPRTRRAAATARRPSARAPAGRTSAGLVNLNTADTETLTTLPGIGPVLAARIVAYRDSAGPFPDLVSLEVVPGVGPATVERLKDRARAGRH